MIGDAEGVVWGIENPRDYSLSVDCTALLRASKRIREELRQSLRRPIYSLTINEPWIYSIWPTPAQFVLDLVLPLFAGSPGTLYVEFLPDGLPNTRSKVIFHNHIARATSAEDCILRTRFDTREKGIYLDALRAFAFAISWMQRRNEMKELPRLEVVLDMRISQDGRGFVQDAALTYPELLNVLRTSKSISCAYHPSVVQK